MLPISMLRNHRHGIIARSALVTIIAFLVASIGTIALTSYETSQRVNNEVHTRLNELLDTVQNTVKIACFANDQNLAKQVAQGLLSNSEVLQVSIRTAEQPLAEIGRTAGENKYGKASAIQVVREIESPFIPGTTVGQVIVTSDPNVTNAQRNESIAIAIKHTLLQLGFVTSIIIISLIFFIVRPIRQLATRLNEMHPTQGDRLVVPRGHEQTEIGLLVGKFNELSDSLVRSLDQAKEARQAAETAARAKATFLANMSHEIRTPINAVLGMARIGLRDSQTTQARDHFEQILTSGNHLLGVINDVLDYSKIEAGKFTIVEQPFQLADLLNTVSNLTQPLLKQKAITFELRGERALQESWFQGDRQRLQQILVNLISNAIKFTTSGSVAVEISGQPGNLHFAVIDTGIGMSDEQMSRLFTAFEQADSSMSRRFGGSGLGLAISQRLANLMKGTISVSSRLGQGSRFTLTLPLPSSLPSTNRDSILNNTQAAASLSGLHLLAAEDVEINRYILQDLIREFGGKVSFAVNGKQAVEMIQANPHAFDLILMDVQMPEMDGLEATRIIKTLAPQLPIVGLTAHALEEERRHCLEAGMVDRVTKPIDPDQLIQSILRWSERPATAATKSADAPAAKSTAPQQEQPTLIDWQALTLHFKGKQAFINKLLQTALQTQGNLVEDLRTAAAQEDFASIAFHAHKIKGIAGNLCAPSIEAEAAALDQLAKAKDQTATVLAAKLADKLRQMHTEIGEHLTAHP